MIIQILIFMKRVTKNIYRQVDDDEDNNLLLPHVSSVRLSVSKMLFTVLLMLTFLVAFIYMEIFSIIRSNPKIQNHR